jgi:hypothetical protein
MNKTAIGVLVLILSVLAGGYYLWSRPDIESGIDAAPQGFEAELDTPL